MSLFDFFRRKPEEQRDQNLSVLDLKNLNGCSTNITAKNVYQITVVKACVELIADTVAGLSHAVYQKTPDGRKKIDGHRVQQALDNPNELQTGFVFKQTLQSNLLIGGNAYGYIESSPKNTKLYLLDPARTDATYKGQLTYTTYVGDARTTLSPDRVFHIPGLGTGIKGMSPIEQAKVTLELAASTVEYGKNFFENGCQLGGLLTSDKSYGKDLETPQRILDSFNLKHQGSKRAFRVGLLQAGFGFTPLSVNNEQAQFLATREFSDKQIASQLFKVPLHMVGLAESSASIEQRGIEFLQYTLMPWLKRWEAEINRKLFTEAEKRQGYYFEFSTESLLRADTTTRYTAYNVGRMGGWLTLNEIRAWENLPGIGPDGDKFIQPLNTGTLEDIKPIPDEPPADNEPKLNPNTLPKVRSQEELPSDALRIAVEASIGRLLKKESQTIRNGSKRNLKAEERNIQGFNAFLQDFYIVKFPEIIRNEFRGLRESLGTDLDKFAEWHCTESRKDLALALWDGDPAQAIETLLETWQERRAEQIKEKLI